MKVLLAMILELSLLEFRKQLTRGHTNITYVYTFKYKKRNQKE